MRTWIRLNSLLGKVLLSTSLAITLLFAVAGWIVLEEASRLTGLSLEQEVQAGFRAYDSLLRSRAEDLEDITKILSRMPDVRAAFSTGDHATIRDSAEEIWRHLGREDAIFVVCDPNGAVIASLGHTPEPALLQLPFVQAASARFPGQSSGFLMFGTKLFQTVVAPVYVETARGATLISVLVAGYVVDDGVARRLRDDAGGTHFVFTVNGVTRASSTESTLPPESQFVRELKHPLADLEGRPIGELRISRSFEAAHRFIDRLRRDAFLAWAVALCTALTLIYVSSRRILQPVADMDGAAQAIAGGDYGCQLPVRSDDELGRLARTFNAMSASIREAREQLIRQERISTIGRLSTSLVHDLRNPLAAIYGGAELLVDSDLSPAQVKRLAGNIYKSSRRIQELLQDLLNVSRGSEEQKENCRLSEVVGAALEGCLHQAEGQGVKIQAVIPQEIELSVARARVERVFLNLASNAIDAMPNGGTLNILAEQSNGVVMVRIHDSGAGVPVHIRDHLFQPFVTAGKRSGLGLGLALSRQTILEHGGDLWLDTTVNSGACFRIRLQSGEVEDKMSSG